MVWCVMPLTPFSPFCCVLSIYNITSSGKFRAKGTLHDQGATNVLITE